MSKKEKDKEKPKSAVNKCLRQDEMLRGERDGLAEWNMTADWLK